MTIGRTPIRPSIRHRRVVKQPNRYVGLVALVVTVALLLQVYWIQSNFGDLASRTDHPPLDQELLDRLTARLITLYECEYCLGNGSVNDPDRPGERMLCTICFGVGYHATRRYTEEDRMCITCGGMGRRYDEHGDAEFCPRCDGRGMVVMED